MMKLTKNEARELERRNQPWPDHLEEVPLVDWRYVTPDHRPGQDERIQVWRSNKFLVQVFRTPKGHTRISVNRTSWDLNQQRWREDISWDDLQTIKAQTGWGDSWAVEIFPADSEVVNVANMRHLFICPEPPEFAWRAHGRPGPKN